jgi:hypothetical protein
MAFIAIAALAAVAVVPGQQRFRAGVELVHFGVVVTDRSGAPITGLTADDFEVIEEGTRQTIQHFAAGDPDAMPPLHLGFLLDMSGSMERDIPTCARPPSGSWGRSTRPRTSRSWISTRKCAWRGSRPTTFPRLIERIRMRQTRGMDRLLRRARDLSARHRGADGQKIAVVYTDGADTRSTLNRTEVLDLLKASDVTMYVIGYLEGHSSSARLDQRQLLSRFSTSDRRSGVLPVEPPGGRRIYDQIRARSCRATASATSRRRARRRRVARRPDSGDAGGPEGGRIRTRAGYFAPWRPQQP